jgi:hypothetical protein
LIRSSSTRTASTSPHLDALRFQKRPSQQTRSRSQTPNIRFLGAVFR